MLWVSGLVVVLVVAGVWVAVTDPLAVSKPSGSGVADNADPTGTYTVTREDLSSQTQVSATLGYAGSVSVVNRAQGTVTSLPVAGRVITQGHVLYRVNGAPVVLLAGRTPAYRALSDDEKGADVTELNTDLVALGEVTRAEIGSDPNEFSTWTTVGVDKLQARLGLTETGTLSLGQVVFVPAAVRVTSVSATLGGGAQPGQPVLSATSTRRQVAIALDADQQSQITVGEKVSITLPDDRSTPGVVSSVGKVATTPQGGGDPTITVKVTPRHPGSTGSVDQVPVTVTITTARVKHALVVPVDALLAQTDASYAVETIDSAGVHRLVPVTLGLFDDADGMVQVTGTGLTTGQHVVVPAL